MGEIDLSGQITKTAIKVHKKLGPDLLDSTYKMCLKNIPVIRKNIFHSFISFINMISVYFYISRYTDAIIGRGCHPLFINTFWDFVTFLFLSNAAFLLTSIFRFISLPTDMIFYMRLCIKSRVKRSCHNQINYLTLFT